MKSKIPDGKKPFQHSFKVKAEDIDELNHVNNVVYLKWIQNISEMHWDDLAPIEIKEKYVWFVLRHEIDYLGQAFLNDKMTVFTWVEKTEGVKSYRVVHIYCDDKLLVKSKTTWCSLDAKTLRPKRIEGLESM